jgi:hypothetical protein
VTISTRFMNSRQNALIPKLFVRCSNEIIKLIAVTIASRLNIRLQDINFKLPKGLIVREIAPSPKEKKLHCFTNSYQELRSNAHSKPI